MFNETLDKDDKFPFLMKINIPTENVGPISKLLSQLDLLDTINAYAASIYAIPRDANVGISSTYNNYYGGVLNGVDSTNYNSLYELKLPTFKLLFKDRPKPPITIEEIYKSAKNFNTETTAPPGGGFDPGGGGGPPPNQLGGDLGGIGQPPAGSRQPTDMDIFNSWKRRKIDAFVKTS